ncbi:CaiB/BaiF CoA transferase family protein [Pseudonocardia thermophila]|jgi:Predicted acyl-CoA transferases/carnitine dehydratase|uniref:CaiB/BaiF CoA transferase family protein n=1 Tax=Pseudonocardia thermophila TaxID=1848 RepID=UPI00248E1DE1|nr:CoA transferase [Pseudonocardia thermophila]
MTTVQGTPLEGIRVVELGQLIAGPFCGQLLADFGADVVKVEPPGGGDPMRRWGHQVEGKSLSWAVIARGKRCVTADLRTPEGVATVARLAEQADVLVENFRPGTLERFGLGWDVLSAANPGLVLVRVSGFGQDGPYAHRAGYGSIGEAMGGLRHLTGEPDRPPSRTGVSIGDLLAGMHAAFGALLALQARSRTGRGQVVDVSIYESVLAMTEALVPDYALAGVIRGRSGAVLPGIAPSNVYPTRDGELLLVAANQDTVFRRLAAAMGRPELATDPDYATHAARGAHQQQLDELIADWTSGLPAEEVLARLDEHAVPAGRVYTAADMLADPHFQARASIIEVPDDVLGTVPMQAVAPRLSETPGRVRWTGPELGAHQAEVVDDLPVERDAS